MDSKASRDWAYSTLNPIVGTVVMTSPTLSLYRSVVFPALSWQPQLAPSLPLARHGKARGWHTRPSIKMRISFLAHSMPDSHDTEAPILYVYAAATGWPGAQSLRVPSFGADGRTPVGV